MPAHPLTKGQLDEAKRLKEHFIAWQAKRRQAGEECSQEWAAEQLKFGQSALNQYLNGKIPLNPDAASKLARLMSIQVADFSPLVANEIAQLGGNAGAGAAQGAAAPIQITRRRWPFPAIDEEKMRRLSRDDALRIEMAILLAAAQISIDLRVEKSRRAA